MAVWVYVQPVILTSKCLIQFKTKHSEYASVPSEHLQSPAYKSIPRDLLSTSEEPKLGLQYALQLKSNSLNPTHKIVFQHRFAEIFANKPKSTPTFGIPTLNHFKTAKIFYRQNWHHRSPKTPPWSICTPSILLNLAEDKKSDTSSTFYMIKFKEIAENFSEYEQIFTDGLNRGRGLERPHSSSMEPRNLSDYQTNLQFTLRNFVHSS